MGCPILLYVFKDFGDGLVGFWVFAEVFIIWDGNFDGLVILHVFSVGMW